jgi:cytoskeletal protein RodZ
MEGLGKKLQEARIARNLTLEEAGRMTKIRPGRLAEIENEDFSQFASLAYAKGFLLIYGKFLDVDVSPYTEAFETSEHVTVDGYAYLQDNPAPAPSRPVVIRRQSGGRGSLLPFAIGVIVLVGGFMAMKAILDIQRVKPAKTPARGSSPTATAVPENIIAPHALPAENAPTSTPAVTIAPVTQPTVAATPSTPAPVPFASPSEPEVRRAEPVNPKDAPKTKPTVSPAPKKPARSPSPRPTVGPRLSPSPLPRFTPR